ncbi:hypothetical protein PN499_26405 [Kamptonema animale CS-326]|jgi:hypothetical protein|uniref:hypothetical protein n=1 Tax=Kamptonema animale TaxID=92934 RepID=UPI00232DA57B|nr:hypothetical protein [Kamptonema animale]MDB9514740.1 hypothetical protein [Kamptonema animale CS-326]
MPNMPQKFETIFDPNPFNDGRIVFGVDFGKFSVYAGGEIPIVSLKEINAFLPPVGSIVGAIDSGSTIKGTARAAVGSARQIAGLKAIGRRVGIGSIAGVIGVSLEGFGSAEIGAAVGPKIDGKLSLLPSLTVRNAFDQVLATTDLIGNAQAILGYLGEIVEANANAEIARFAGDVAVFDSQIRSRVQRLGPIRDQSVYGTRLGGREVFEDKKLQAIVPSVRALTADQRGRFNDGRGLQLVNNCLKYGGGLGCYESKYLSVAGSGKNYGNSALANCINGGGGRACYQKYGR